MGLFTPVGYKEYKRLAKINDGAIALLMKTKRKKISNEFVFIVEKPKQFSIKMNELKMVQQSFKRENEISDECYFNFYPLEENFTLKNNEITLDDGSTYSVRGVPFYDSLTGKY